ncbi:Coenzyme F420:L-glutamate ligase [uncultured archaeon]|nr:Coenzyme F420:L-glutamate ligase [uncultured archaeon]
MAAANPVIEAIAARRSIRKFEDKPVPSGLESELLRAAVNSPSAMNLQHWRFVVISDKAKIRELSDAVKRLFAPQGLTGPMMARFSSKDDTIFHGAPLIILVCADRHSGQWAEIDCGIVAENMFLAAYSLGLGSCFIGFAQVLNRDRLLLSTLGIPDNFEVIAPLIFGYPAEKKPGQKRTFEDKVLKRI